MVYEEPIESPQEVVMDEQVGGERVVSKTKIDDVTLHFNVINSAEIFLASALHRDASGADRRLSNPIGYCSLFH